MQLVQPDGTGSPRRDAIPHLRVKVVALVPCGQAGCGPFTLVAQSQYPLHRGMPIEQVRAIEELAPALEKAFEFDRSLIVEAFIAGTELTGGVLGNDNPEALPLIEIIPGDGYEFFDYEAKYKPGATREICPAPIDENLAQKARTYAVTAHQVLACRGYSRTDMILRDGDIFVLETNTIPGMTETSLVPLAAKTAGLSLSQLLDRLIELSLESTDSG